MQILMSHRKKTPFYHIPFAVLDVLVCLFLESAKLVTDQEEEREQVCISLPSEGQRRACSALAVAQLGLPQVPINYA